MKLMFLYLFILFTYNKYCISTYIIKFFNYYTNFLTSNYLQPRRIGIHSQ